MDKQVPCQKGHSENKLACLTSKNTKHHTFTSVQVPRKSWTTVKEQIILLNHTVVAGIVVHVCNSSTWEADICANIYEFETSLVYKQTQDSQGLHTEKPSLQKKKKNSCMSNLREPICFKKKKKKKLFYNILLQSRDASLSLCKPYA